MTTGDHCHAHNRKGESCGLPAGWGTDHVGVGLCRIHGGNSPNGRKQGLRLMAKAEAARFGLPREIDAHAALEEDVWRTQGLIDWYGSKIEELDPGALVRGVASIRETVHADGTTERHTTVAANISTWLLLYNSERKHLVEVCRSAIQCGVEERRVRVAEQTGELIVQVIRATLQDLGVADHPDAFTVVARHLRAVG